MASSKVCTTECWLMTLARGCRWRAFSGCISRKVVTQDCMDRSRSCCRTRTSRSIGKCSEKTSFRVGTRTATTERPYYHTSSWHHKKSRKWRRKFPFQKAKILSPFELYNIRVHFILNFLINISVRSWIIGEKCFWIIDTFRPHLSL